MGLMFHWNGDIISWKSQKTKEITFMICKATKGKIVDNQFKKETDID
jgi:hypothetical protein